MSATVFTPETIQTARELWANGVAARQIAETIGVNRATLLGYAQSHRDLFPYKGISKAKRRAAVEAFQRDRPKDATWIGNGRWVRHVSRTHVSGEVHTMPRVSMIDDREGE